MALSASKFVPIQGAFDIDPSQTVGLSLRVRGGWLINAGSALFQSVAGAILTLGASVTTFVEVNTVGVIVGNTTGFTSGFTSLYAVTTDTVGLTAIEDWRHSPANDRTLNPLATIASGSTIGGPMVVFMQTIADASADTDIIVRDKIRVLDFWFLNTGGAAHATLDTIQLKNGATPITNAVAKTATVNAVVRAGTKDPAQIVIAAGGTLRHTAVHNTNVAGVAYTLAVHVP